MTSSQGHEVCARFSRPPLVKHYPTPVSTDGNYGLFLKRMKEVEFV